MTDEVAKRLAEALERLTEEVRKAKKPVQWDYLPDLPAPRRPVVEWPKVLPSPYTLG